jgi:Fanconi-associated nuclease 1
MLQRRLGRLEKKLNVPPEERHTSAGQLLKPEAVTVEGIRIHKRASSLHLDGTGRAVNKTPLQSAGESSLRWTPRSLKPQKISTVPLKGKYEVRLQIAFHALSSFTIL